MVKTKKNGKKKWSWKKRTGVGCLGIIGLFFAFILVYITFITNIGSWLVAQMRSETDEQQEVQVEASDLTTEITDEGIVLMENQDDLLPLETSSENKQRINLFGTRAVQVLFNSGGSTATDASDALKLEDALQSEEGNFELNEDLLHLHYNFINEEGEISIDEADAPDNFSDSEVLGTYGNSILPEVPVSAYEDDSLYEGEQTLLEQSQEFSDTAMVVLGRGGGEMVDLSPSELQLSEEESELIDLVANNFDDVILVLNTANVMQLDFIEDYPSIKGVVWMGYPGESGTLSLARILNGTVNPSGRLVNTWPSDLMNHPAHRNYMGVDENGEWDEEYKYDNMPEDKGYFVQYHEGIYVGYRYYETRHATDESYNYEEEVLYPFGHGLSYTSFEKEILSMEEESDQVTLEVQVENTGDVAGKEVVQIYSNPPYSGEIEKATSNLVSFAKTEELEPGETATLSLEIPLEDLASYDYAENEAYVLEEGEYELHLKNNSHETLDMESFNLDEAIVFNEENDGSRPSDQTVATTQFEDAHYIDDYLTREWNEDSRAFTGAQEEDFTAEQEVVDALDYELPTDEELGLTEEDMPEVGVEHDEPIQLEDMVGIDKDDEKWDEFVSQLTLDEMTEIAGSGAYQIAGVDRLGIPRTLSPDGTMAIASNLYSGPMMGTVGVGVTYPSPIVLASTWNTEIAREMGDTVGREAQSFGYAGWYAPAMNIHRTPFNGRNFEYYSEDGVLAGEIAAEVVGGATDQGIITHLKHFAFNERENGVRNSLFTWSNEQALREVYLKPFEIAVKEGGSLGVMSSFNYIGYDWAGGNENLLNNVLRDEWGFEGYVITDAHMYGHMDLMQMLYNGGDVSLDPLAPWLGGRRHANTLLEYAEEEEYEDYRIGTVKNLHRANKDILYAVSQTWPVTESE